MRLKIQWLGALGALLLLGGTRVFAADCGDTTNAGANVNCSCGDTVTTNTKLDNADPVTTTLCGSRGLTLGTGVTVNMSGRSIQAALGNTESGVVMANNSTLNGAGEVVGFGGFGVINVSFTGGQVVTGVQSRNNGEAGFSFRNASTLQNNTASGNGRAGIDISVGSNHVLFSNTCFNNGESGIHVISASDSLVQKNIVYANNGPGILVQSGVGHRLLANESYRNTSGFTVSANGMTLEGNKAESNQGDGINVGGSDNVLTLNSAKVNAGTGINVGGSGNRLRDNHASENRGNGTFAVGGGVDDGKNTGDRNGGNFQCTVNFVPCKP